MDKLLQAYGFKNGQLDTNYGYVKDVNEAVVAKYGMEESKPVLSTPEEFISAAYFFPNILPWNHNAAAAEKELPHKKEGGLKLLSMWLKKKAEILSPMFYSGLTEEEISNSTKAYRDVMILLNGQFKLPAEAITEYYTAAISNYLISLSEERLQTITEEKQFSFILGPLIGYYVDPNKNNFDALVRSFSLLDNFNINKTSHTSATNYYRLLDDLDALISAALKEQISLQTQPTN